MEGVRTRPRTSDKGGRSLGKGTGRRERSQKSVIQTNVRDSMVTRRRPRRETASKKEKGKVPGNFHLFLTTVQTE